MKKIPQIVILLIMSLALPSMAAGDNPENISVYRNTIKVVSNGTAIDADNFLYNGTTYIPLRAVSEALGANVEWDEEEKTARITEKEKGLAGESFLTYIDIIYAYQYMNDYSDFYSSIRTVISNYYSAINAKYKVDEYFDEVVEHYYAYKEYIHWDTVNAMLQDYDKDIVGAIKYYLEEADANLTHCVDEANKFRFAKDEYKEIYANNYLEYNNKAVDAYTNAGIIAGLRLNSIRNYIYSVGNSDNALNLISSVPTFGLKQEGSNKFDELIQYYKDNWNNTTQPVDFEDIP